MKYRVKWAMQDLNRLSNARRHLTSHKRIDILSARLNRVFPSLVPKYRREFWHYWILVRQYQDNGKRLPD